MKICILSMQRVQNFGSLLQGYSLKKILEEYGNEVHFIDIQRNESDDSLLNQSSDIVTNGMVTKILDKLNKIDKYTLNRIIIKLKSSKQDNLFENFRLNNLQITLSDNSEEYDACVIGSDEVFNCLTPSSWGFTTQLFGNVPNAKKVITYAASCGATEYQSLPEAVAEKISKTFENVSAISVRDMNTKDFVEHLTDKMVYSHLDPVMIGNFDSEMKRIGLSINLPQKYCLIYSYYNRICDKKEIKAIKSFCKSKKLQIISIGAPQMWIKNHIVGNPFEMLNVFKNADFVITDTFHGTIFSAKYSKRFAVMTRDSNFNKLSDLIKKLNIENHYVKSFINLDNVYSIENDFNEIKKIEKNAKREAVQYFNEYL